MISDDGIRIFQDVAGENADHGFVGADDPFVRPLLAPAREQQERVPRRCRPSSLALASMISCSVTSSTVPCCST